MGDARLHGKAVASGNHMGTYSPYPQGLNMGNASHSMQTADALSILPGFLKCTHYAYGMLVKANSKLAV